MWGISVTVVSLPWMDVLQLFRIESVTVASSRGVLSVVVELSLSVSFCYLTEQGDKANRQPHPSVKSTQTFAYALLFRGLRCYRDANRDAGQVREETPSCTWLMAPWD